MTDATTPLVDTTKVTPPLPTSEGGLQTYEDCLTLISGLENEASPANLQAGLKKLGGFFKTRVGKRSSEKERDGGEAVKRAITGGRTFKPYTARALDAPPTDAKLWG